MNTTIKNILEEAWENFNLTPSNPTTIEDIDSNQCKFHLDDTQNIPDSNTLFCGKPHWIDITGKHHSYCRYHYEITHERKSENKKT